mmetsp:Transcript_2959/g.4320  ORF Transcript_2959/g.4320 Transcript_2959/m.4320 type:complete len:922 (+) Transcript_2959:319-3084(+)
MSEHFQPNNGQQYPQPGYGMPQNQYNNNPQPQPNYGMPLTRDQMNNPQIQQNGGTQYAQPPQMPPQQMPPQQMPPQQRPLQQMPPQQPTQTQPTQNTFNNQPQTGHQQYPPQYTNQQFHNQAQFNQQHGSQNNLPPYRPPQMPQQQQTNQVYSSVTLSPQNAANLPRPTYADYYVKPKQPTMPHIESKYDSVGVKHAVQSSTRYIRSTMKVVPKSPNLLKQYGLPFGCVIQPFAKQIRNEKIPKVSSGRHGIVRCSECKAYISPFAMIIGGRRWQCHLCGSMNEIRSSYYSPPDDKGVRVDIDERKELTHGSVEFYAPKEYGSSVPKAPVYVFLIDVSYNAIQNGSVEIVADTILSILTHLSSEVRTKVAFITFNSTIHFYNLNAKLSNPQMLCVPELEKTIIPLRHDLLVNLHTNFELVKKLLTMLPRLFKDSVDPHSCLSAALKTAGRLIKRTGGKILSFVSTIPKLGPIPFTERENHASYNDENKEQELLKPTNEKYRDLSLWFVKDYISINMFITSKSYFDIASIFPLIKYTAGSVKYYPKFEDDRDKSAFQYDLADCLTREQGFDGVLRVRLSTGLEIKNFYGNCFIRGHDILALPNLDESQVYSIELVYKDSFLSTANVGIQAAILYTNSASERMVRVHNLVLPISSSLTDIYRYTDTPTMVSLLGKIAADDFPEKKLSVLRTQIENSVVKSLQSYTKEVSGTVTNGVVVPYSMRYLPLLYSSLLKTTFFSSNTSAPVVADRRMAALQKLSNSNVVKNMLEMYPMVINILSLGKDFSEQDEYPTLLPSLRSVVFDNSTPRLIACCDGYRIRLFANNSFEMNQKEEFEAVQALVPRLNTFPLPNPNKGPIGNTALAKNACKLIYNLRHHFGFMVVILLTGNSPDLNDLVHLCLEDENGSSASYVQSVGKLAQKVYS